MKELEIRNRTSSYVENKFDNVFRSVVFAVNPQKIVEFGILNGFSLECFADAKPAGCQVDAYDLFDEFPYNAAVYSDVIERFSGVDDIKIEKEDFYQGHRKYNDGEIDILHIDIANDGDVFQFAVENYMNKLSSKGVCILEGGSRQRDEVYWMSEYSKRTIAPYLETIQDSYEVMVLNDYPSVTLIKNKIYGKE